MNSSVLASTLVINSQKSKKIYSVSDVHDCIRIQQGLQYISIMAKIIIAWIFFVSYDFQFRAFLGFIDTYC